jgi:tetratricopeptide (TPR) repeat protein
MNLKVFTILLILNALLPFIGIAQTGNKADSLEAVISVTTDPEQKTELLLDLSDELMNIDLNKSLKYCEEAYRLAESSSDEEGKMHACLMLARIYYFKSELDEAMEFAMQAKSIAEDLGDDLYMALSMDAIGVIYYDIGNQAKSSENFFGSLKIYEELDEKDGIGANLCRIGTLYLDQKDYTKAEEYYINSIRIAREINSQDGIASNLNNLAKVYSEKQEYNKALNTYQEALDINIKTGNAYLEASNYLNIADVYLRMKEFDQAIEKTEQAKIIFARIGNKVKLAKSQILLSEIQLQTRQIIESKRLAKAALAIGIEEGYKEINAKAADVLYKISLSKRDSSEAFRYFILAKEYEDSLFLDEKQKTLSSLELRYQFEKNEQELVLARERRNIAIIVISGCLLFSLIIIFLISKQLRLKAKKLQLEKEVHEREIEFKNKEMVLNVMSLMKKNEMLAELSEKLIHIEKEATTDESRDTVKKVAREVQKSQEEEIWKEFSTRFKEVHGDFYNKLLKKYPALTPNDLKLCAFLRLNMSSKDIAELTGQRVSSLETARYRLRQKLGIANSDVNLITFLSSI